MPGGRAHDKVTFLCSIPLGIAACSIFGLTMGMIVVVSFVFAGLLFNGDLDHDAGATCYDRWWIFKYLFWLYMKIMPHRSLWSHGPIIGTVGRIVYVLLIVALSLGLYAGAVQLIGLKWDVTTGLPELSVVIAWVTEHRQELIFTFAGLELGSLSHSIADWIDTWRKKLLS